MSDETNTSTMLADYIRHTLMIKWDDKNREMNRCSSWPIIAVNCRYANLGWERYNIYGRGLKTWTALKFYLERSHPRCLHDPVPYWLYITCLWYASPTRMSSFWWQWPCICSSMCCSHLEYHLVHSKHLINNVCMNNRRNTHTIVD